MLRKHYPLLCLIIGSVVLSLLFFSKLIPHVGEGLIVGGGDGLKNYFTYLYYMQHDTGNHFSGMNYPYGEHVIFTDNMPLLAWIVKGISAYIPGIIPYATGIFNLFVITSFTIGALFLYKILGLFKLPGWWRSLAALFILYFSPQIFKVFGHYGMGILFCLPALFYWLLCYHKFKKKRFLVYYAIASLLFSFLHVYLLAIASIQLLAYLAAYILLNRRRLSISKLLSPLLAAVVPLLCFYGYLKATDPVSDRSQYPYGVMDEVVRGDYLLASKIPPLGELFGFVNHSGAKGHTESYAYLGLVSILVCFFLIFRLFRAGYFKWRRRRLVPAHPLRAYRIWLLTGFLILLFSMGVPFVWGKDWWVEHLSVLRQFRTIGRFSWCFYYIISVYAAIVIYRLYLVLLRRGKVGLSRLLLTLVILIWCWQTSGYVQHFWKSSLADSSGNYAALMGDATFNWSSWLQKAGADPQQFQALVRLPYGHIGSEKIWIEGDNNEAFSVAMQTGLPLMNVMMSRTSWQQTFDNVQMIDGPFSAKPLLERMKEQPLLLMIRQDKDLSPGEQEWRDLGRLIGKRGELAFYRVDTRDLKDNHLKYKDSLLRQVSAQDATEGLIGNTNHAFYYAVHVEQQKGFPEAAIPAPPLHADEEMQLIQTIQLPAVNTVSRDYYISVWVKCSADDYRSPEFRIKQYDAGGSLIAEDELDTKFSTHVINYWFLAERIVELKPNATAIDFHVENPYHRRAYLHLDELAIWPANSVYFYKMPDGRVLLNNRPQ